MLKNLKNDLIKELGLENLSEEKKMEIILSAGRVIQQNIILRVLDELKTEKDKKEFDNFLKEKQDDQDAILKFLQSKIPNLDEIINEEINKFKESSINLLKDIMK